MVKKNTFFSEGIYNTLLRSVKGIQFTKREIDVIACLVNAKRGSEIAQILNLAKPTVTTHLRNIMQKLNCNNQGAVISFFESTPMLPTLRDYFGKLLVETRFNDKLEEIKRHQKSDFVSKKKVSVVWQDTVLKDQIGEQLKKDLAKIGVQVDVKKSQDIPFLIKAHEQETSAENSSKESDNSLVIDVNDIKTYYSSVLKIAISLYPEVKSKKILSDFLEELEKLQYLIQNSNEIEGIYKNYKEAVGQRNIFYFLKKYILSFIFTAILCIAFFYYGLPHISRLFDQDNIVVHTTKLGNFSNYIPQILAGNEAFIGREKELADIERQLKHNQFVILSGRSGIGKTTCALEFARRRSEGRLAIYFDADAQEKISHQYLSILSMLNVNTSNLSKDSEIRFMNNIYKEYNNEILLVFDNVEEYNDIRNYISSLPANVKVIITTTQPELVDNVPQVRLAHFSYDEASKYLHSFLKRDTIEPSILENLIKHTAALPYNLKHAAAYLLNNPFSKFEDAFFNYRLFEQFIVESSPEKNLSWEILQYSACMDPDFISLQILSTVLSADITLMNNAIKSLHEQSLVSFVEDKSGNKGIRIHRTLKSEIRNSMLHFKDKSLSRKTIIHNLMTAFDKIFPVVSHRPSSEWTTANHLLTQVLKLVNLPNVLQIADKREVGNMMYKLGEYYSHVQINRDVALKYAQKALDIRQSLYPINRIQLADSVDSVGRIKLYKSDETAQEGLDLLHRALALREEILPNPHPLIARSLRHVGLGYLKFKFYEKSLEYALKYLSMCQVLDAGMNSDSIAEAYNDVAWVLYKLENFQKALKYSKEAVQGYMQLSENESSHSVYALHTLGVLYLELGNRKEAIKSLSKVLDISKKFKMDNHYVTYLSYFDLGEALFKDGQLEKALKSHEQALKILTELRENTGSDFYDVDTSKKRVSELRALLEKESHSMFNFWTFSFKVLGL